MKWLIGLALLLSSCVVETELKDGVVHSILGYEDSRDSCWYLVTMSSNELTVMVTGKHLGVKGRYVIGDTIKVGK